MTDYPALPPYTIQENPRAKRVILKVLPQQGVVVVIPKDFSRNKVAAIVAEK